MNSVDGAKRGSSGMERDSQMVEVVVGRVGINFCLLTHAEEKKKRQN